jgi:type I restriction enzyme, S subunit
MMETLKTICSYRNEKTDVSVLDEDALYISTESMAPNRGGVSMAASVPVDGKVSCFHVGDTLVSNIRPYFKKVWQADRNGYCSNDVLIFKPENGCNPDYLFWLLSSDEFFDYVMATSKGTKMPRGDKSAILNYAIPSHEEMAQQAIVMTLNPLREKIELNTKLNGYLAA